MLYRSRTVAMVPGGRFFVVGVLFNTAIAIFAIFTVRLREATGEVLPQHQFSLRTLKRMTGWTRVAASGARRTTVRASAPGSAFVAAQPVSSAGRHEKRRIENPQYRYFRNADRDRNGKV